MTWNIDQWTIAGKNVMVTVSLTSLLHGSLLLVLSISLYPKWLGKKKTLLEIRSDIKSGSLLGINPLDTHCEISNIKIAWFKRGKDYLRQSLPRTPSNSYNQWYHRKYPPNLTKRCKISIKLDTKYSWVKGI